ncbi:efflux transporter outer membrane subunit [Paludibacterium sp. B53371]|uniref:efflux transporter outer membrane subunit n=1 Tax=Paludibacterium sp. B53371 TaxID=2806263 RepID=UPI001C043E81|nr:efflux transporter outer membrane subunit [Paludibacterium sp. B53371]
MRSGWLCGVVCLLAGCAVGPDYQVPRSEVPAHFAVAGTVLNEHLPQADWWLAFADPALNALVGQALQQNLDLQAAWARVRQAEALRGVAGGAAWPQVNAQAQQTRDHLSTRGEQFANIPFPNPQNQFTDTRVGLSASWELDLFGYRARSLEAATARAGSAVEVARATALATAASVTRSYLDLRALQQRVQVAQRRLWLAEESLRLVRLQQQAGLVGLQEVNQAEAAARQAAAALPPLQTGVRTDLDALAVLCGQTPRALDELLADAAPLPAQPAVVGVGLPSDLLQRRPDVRRAERDLAAASAEVGVATAAQYPRFSLVGSLGVDAIHQGQLTDQAARYWSVGPSLALPLFAGGALSQQLRAQQAAYEAALANYRQVVLQALADTESALMRYDRELARSQQLDAARRAAAGTLALTQRRVAVGEAAELEALQAESAWQQASDAWLQSQSASLQALVGLYQSLGGDVR